MEFHNLTPFSALAFSALDPDNNEHHVVVMRVTYQLVRQGDTHHYECVVLDNDPPPLCFADEYYGELNFSSVRQESDLAPYKPHCDVIVNGTAYMPGGQQAARSSIRVKIHRPDQPASLPERPQPLNPLMELSPRQMAAWQAELKRSKNARLPGKVLLDKTLTITGPRWFKKRFPLVRLLQWAVRCGTLGLIRPNPWKLTSPQKIASLPIRYEHVWGGENRINAGDDAAPRVKKKHRLTPEQLTGHPDKDAPPEQQAIAHEACLTNPIGKGYANDWWLNATKAKQLPAPQIEWPDAPISAALFWRAAKGKADGEKSKALTPAGLGCVGRAWTPRLQWAGTYDQDWLDNKHPGLPGDFNFTYWNCAPADQQIEFLPYDACITVSGMYPDGEIHTQLPRHRPFLLARYEAGMLPLPLLTDTVIIDTDAMTLTLVHRLSLSKNPLRKVLEARFETDPDAPLVKLARNTEATDAIAQSPEEIIHD